MEETQRTKHNIVDMYWLINQKLYDKEELNSDPKEVGVLTIGYNADFNNLRIGFFEIQSDSITKSSINKDKMRFLTSINIFSETAFKILNNQVDFYNLERIIGAENPWTPNITLFSKEDDRFIIKTMSTNGEKFMFTFSKSEFSCLQTALNFMINGGSWSNYLNIRK